MIPVYESLPSEPFRLDKTGMSYYDDFLDPKELAYLQKNKNRTGKIVYMTPEEYYKECSRPEVLNSTPESLKQQRSRDNDSLEYHKDLLENGEKLNLCFINYTNGGQEGLHRMMVVGDLYGWNKKFPVLVVTVYDQDRENREQIIRDLRKFENYYMDEICEDALWQNYHIEDISDTDGWKKEYCKFLSDLAYEKTEDKIQFDCGFDKSDKDNLYVYVTEYNGSDVSNNSQWKNFYISNICSSSESAPLSAMSGTIDYDDLEDLGDMDILDYFFKKY